MPRPPVLPVIDWKNVLENGKTWDEWLDAAESAEQAAKMRERFDNYQVPADCADCQRNLSRAVHIIAIAEDWCGDVIRHAPVVAKLAAASDKVKLRFISREDRPDVFARFLTNGGEAIPKFIFLSSDFVECGNWGPMQADCRRLVALGKAIGNVGAGRDKVREIYAADPGCDTAFHEICDLVCLAGATSVE